MRVCPVGEDSKRKWPSPRQRQPDYERSSKPVVNENCAFSSDLRVDHPPPAPNSCPVTLQPSSPPFIDCQSARNASAATSTSRLCRDALCLLRCTREAPHHSSGSLSLPWCNSWWQWKHSVPSFFVFGERVTFVVCRTFNAPVPDLTVALRDTGRGNRWIGSCYFACAISPVWPNLEKAVFFLCRCLCKNWFCIAQTCIVVLNDLGCDSSELRFVGCACWWCSVLNSAINYARCIYVLAVCFLARRMR